MRKTVLAFAVAAMFGGLGGHALAGPVDDYIGLKVAELLDLKCRALKYVEHSYIIEAQVRALDQTAEWSWLESGKFTNEDYWRWIDERNAEAQAKVDSTGGCTPLAGTYLQVGRDAANGLIAQGLLLALHFDSLPETDMDRMALVPDRRQALMIYDALLQQLYGANYQRFIEWHRAQAAGSLPPPTFEDPYAIYDTYSFRSYEDNEKALEARRRAVGVLDAVQFEVAAESNGWLVQPQHLDGGWIIPNLVRADAPEERLVVVQGPASYSTSDPDGLYYQVLARTPEGGLRLMTFGADVKALGPTPLARLYVPNMPLPAGVDDWSYFNHPSFREMSMVWDGEPAAGPCLGGPCFDYPSEVFDAIGRRGEQGQVELFLADSPVAEPPVIAPGNYRSGRISSRHFHALMGG